MATKSTKSARASKKPAMSSRTLGAFRAHLTRATNALAATRSKTERAALRETIARLEQACRSGAR